jgi:hypothetical protein
MKHRHAPRLALVLLDRLVPDSEPLAGDLVEEFTERRSVVWFWVQVLAAIAAAWSTRNVEIRPLRLVDQQPADALERTRRMALRFPSVNLSGSPIAGVGGLTLLTLICLMTRTVPTAWLLLLASALTGVVLGLLRVAVRDRVHAAGPTSLSIRMG